MKWQIINKEQAQRIFADNAVLFGETDGIPDRKAAQFTGQEAVDFARRMGQNIPATYGGYGIGEYTECYLTEKGFMIAATYCNVKALHKAGA